MYKHDNPADGLRFIADWLDKKFGDAGFNDEVQRDCRKWAGEIDALILASKNVCDTLGAAEWGSPEHGEEMYRECIDAHHTALRNALAFIKESRP